MRNSSSTLGNNSLEPHLMLNTDFGSAVYLAYSDYGLKIFNNLVKLTSLNGPSNLSSANYSSCTGNASGIMNLSTSLLTASIVTDNLDNPSAEKAASYIIDYSDTKYTEILEINSYDSLKGICAINELNWGQTKGINSTRPVVRQGLNTSSTFAAGYNGVFFRPVIWNHEI